MSEKKVLVITGSPRLDGNSDRLADAFIEGAVSAENDVTRFDSGRMNIGPCKACGQCFTNGNACAVSNGFNTIAPEILKSDVIVFVTPLYWFSFTSQIKCVIDKMYSFCESGKDLSGKECLLIVCGGSADEPDYEGIATTYRLMASYLKWTDRGILKAMDVTEKGEVKNTPYIDQATEMGKNI